MIQILSMYFHERVLPRKILKPHLIYDKAFDMWVVFESNTKSLDEELFKFSYKLNYERSLKLKALEHAK